jgi:ribosome biogenesis GTPase
VGAERRPVAPGDEVRIAPTTDGEAAIEEVLPRRSKLSRRSGHRGESEQVLAANVDQLAIVVAVHRPPLRPGLIDRMIVAATNHALSPLVVLNKVDLGRGDAMREVRRTFTDLGYPVFLTSAKDGTGVRELAAALADRVTVFSGHSGVGKSSLLNAIEPSFALKVGKVARRGIRGRHTTTRAELLPLPRGGYVVDTPGVRAFGLWDLEAADLDIFFKEFQPLIESCRFYDCTHSHEPDCAVRSAVEGGELQGNRYAAYLRILKTIEEGREGTR